MNKLYKILKFILLLPVIPIIGVEGGNGGAGAGDGSGSGGGEGAGAGGDDKKFSQAEVDDLINKRLGREAKKYEKYKDLNDEELETYKKWKADQEAAKQKQMTDLEKEKAAREKAEKEKTDALTKANQRLIRAAFLVSAKEIAEDRRDAAYKLADLSSVTVDDNGNVDEKLLKAAVEEVLKSNPFLKGTTQSPNVGGGAGNGGGTLTAEEIAKNKAEERNKKQSERKFW